MDLLNNATRKMQLTLQKVDDKLNEDAVKKESRK
jgi:hypothetical protein